MRFPHRVCGPCVHSTACAAWRHSLNRHESICVARERPPCVLACGELGCNCIALRCSAWHHITLQWLAPTLWSGPP